VAWGRAPWGGAPWTRAAYSNQSTLPDFEALLADPEAERIIIAILHPYDPVAGGETQLLYSDRPWEAGAPAALIRLKGVEVESAIFAGGFGASGAPVVPRFGAVVLHPDESGGSQPLNELGPSDLDPLSRYWWDGRALECRLLGPDFSLSQGQPVLVGFSEDVEWDRKRFEVVLRDSAQRLQKPIQTERYAGTGGLEGGADLKGKTKPVTIGVAYNVRPTIVDRANGVVQWHSGESNAVLAAYDRGIALIDDGDMADVYAWSPVSGHFVTDLAHSVARYGAALAGDPTLDVEGDAEPALGGYVESPGGVHQRVVRRAGFTTAELDGASYAAVDGVTTGRCGFYVAEGEGEAEIPAFLDRIFPDTVLGFWELTRTGLMRVVALEFTSPLRTIKAHQMGGTDEATYSPKRLRTAPVIFRHKLGYRKVWQVQGPSELATLVSDAHRDFVGQEYRYPEPSEDLAIEALRRLPGDFTGTSLFADETDAETEQDRRLALTKDQKDTYEVDFREHEWLLRLGDTVTVEWPQWGLGAGRDFLVLRIRERSDARKTTAELWG
jgi:hypothetical protein